MNVQVRISGGLQNYINHTNPEVKRLVYFFRKLNMASAANMNAVRETMDVLLEISRLLNTGLDVESLSLCVRLCEQGINPEALSSVIKELRKASDAMKVSESSKG